MQIDLTEFLTDLEQGAKSGLTTTADVIDVDDFPSVDQMYSEAPKWLRIDDVVAVVADLKGSTRLNFSKHANSSARLYEGVTGSLVRTVTKFEPAFVDIQGDGLFALFHGPRRYERALCAGITLKTFSQESLEPLVKAHFSDQFPKTGIKVGMHASTLLVKKVGVRGTNKPVWAGRAVNWATKAAQAADAHELVATRKVFEHFQDNDFVRYSCGCGGPVSDLWVRAEVESLPIEQTGGDCMRLTSKWCATCGPEFCQKVLDGATVREAASAA